MKIGNIQVDNPLFLAPMAGVTDWAFRTICARLGAGVTVTEMVSSRALCYKDQKSAKLLRKNEGSVCGAQIFGNDPDIMAKGAVLALEISGCDFIDVNMGCPMPKIAGSGDGCGLMRTPELAADIVKAISRAVEVPVTVKCRLGWDKGSINVLDFTKRMEDAGAAMVAVHGRTRSMLYSGTADWDMIHKVKEQLSIPVIANGDITDGQAAARCLKRTGADGLMIGRSVFGDPWIFREVQAALRGEESPGRPGLADRVAVALEQFRLAEQDHGEHIACLEARKHFAWYLRGVPHSSYYKNQITSLTTMEDIYRVAKDVVRDLS
ncbi:MAG TPA: tRNA dihydrouridine synthase DusB [Clostridiales bacterium]|nr:tRNA dihydrouridine synthase DusB [Clostridiales bacterium]